MGGCISAREWGRQQAKLSPPWTEEKWQRVGAIFGVDFLAGDLDDLADDESDREAA